MIQRTRDRGVAILTVVVAVIIIGGISSAFFLLSVSEQRESTKGRDRARATYLAEAGTEVAANSLRQAIANNPMIMSDPAAGGTPFNQLVVDQIVTIDGVPVQAKAMKRQIITIPPKPSALRIAYASFEILGYARYGGNAAKSTDTMASESVVYKMVETNGTPLFQFLAFYDGDMEVNPGPYAHFHGRMHTNSDMYLTDRDARGMVLDTDHLQAVGNMYRSYSSRLPDGSMGTTPVETGATGDIWVRKMGTTPLDDATIDLNPANDPGLVRWDLKLNSEASDWSTQAQSNWNGGVMDGKMGAQTMVPPEIQSMQAGGFYDKAATSEGLKIVDNQVFQNGTNITSELKATDPTIITESSIYDAREEKDVPLVTVDVGKLMNTKFRPSNGILYATSTTATAEKPSGLQLVNGGYIAPPPTGVEVKTPGFTVVSPLPVYVKGDYNGKTDPATGLSMRRKDSTTGATYNQTLNAAGDKVDTVPTAIIADAVNMLSNDWKGKTKGSVPRASNTTFNTAIISGNQSTGAAPGTYGNGYNGGLQNLPRFHEDWSSIKANISGSFVNLWRSKIATGVYGKGGVYSPPIRNWDFDQKFDQPGGTPPGMPFAISVGRTTYEEGWVRGTVGTKYDLMPTIK